jgi:hypothetical protein
MATPDWTRPVLKRRIRPAPPLVTAILCAAAFAVGMTVDREPSRIVVPVIAPVSVAVPPAPPPQVVVAPVPPAAAAPVPQPPAPRATRPQLAAHCLVLSEGQPPDPMCAWDDGFPAISGDGSLIATKYHPVYGQTGNVGESVRFLDTTTGRVVRESIILSPDEYVPGDALDKLRPEVLARAAAVQGELDTGEFRTLIALGDHNLGDDESHVDATRIHAEFSGSAVRIVDPSTNTEIGRHSFGVASPHPLDDATQLCSSWGMRRLAVWWDPTTRIMLGVAEYHTGGCMCSDQTVEEVHRLP